MDADSGSRRGGHANRYESGQALATHLGGLVGRDVAILALPCGGVPVGHVEPLETWSRHDIDRPDTWPTGG